MSGTLRNIGSTLVSQQFLAYICTSMVVFGVGMAFVRVGSLPPLYSYAMGFVVSVPIDHLRKHYQSKTSQEVANV